MLAGRSPSMIVPMASSDATKSRTINPANRLGLDYIAEAKRLGPPVTPMTDVHSHIGGTKAAQLYKQAAELYGINRTYSMTHLDEIEPVRQVLGERVRFIAVPDYREEDRRHHLGRGYLQRLEQYHARGVRIAKFWASPRSTEYAIEMGDPGFMKLDAPVRMEAMQLAAELGMYFMVHIADPDTWFATRFQDASVFGTKRDQYPVLEMLLDRFEQPWIAAHMGGWPEDLGFLSGLLERHPNLYLDTSATKWMVRELSKHSRDELVDFFDRFRGRVLFGSDIVTTDDHLSPSVDEHEMKRKASSPEEAFDLYASRYWALRTLFETDYNGESPIADPDLEMIDPDRYTAMDAPLLRGKSLPPDLLREIYHDAAARLLDPMHAA